MGKLGAFGLKIATFPGLFVVASYRCRIGTLSHLLRYSGWHVTSHISSVAQFNFTTQKVSMGLASGLKL